MGPRTAWLVLLALPARVLPAPAPPPVAASLDVTVEVPLWAGIASLGLLITVATALMGCAWCRRYKNCKFFSARRPSARSAVEEGRPQVVAEAAVIDIAPDDEEPVPANNNVAEDNNNGPISLRELQNIANNNATAYIVSENENRNALGVAARAAAHSRESMVEFEPLPRDITPAHRPLYADWFVPQRRDFPRDRLQYIREIGRGSFGRIVEGDLTDESGARHAVAVRILERHAGPAEHAAFLREATVFRDASDERVLRMLASNLAEDPWLLALQLCDSDLQKYLHQNRPHMCSLNERGVPLRLLTDTAAGLSYLHRRGVVYGSMWSGGVLVRTDADEVRARLGYYGDARATRLSPWSAPEIMAHASLQENASSEIWSLGVVVWEVCSWGDLPPPAPPASAPPPPSLPCPYRDHLYQVMQLCWNSDPERRPTAAQVHDLLRHLHTSHLEDPHTSGDFERRWQTLKPNRIPVVDEYVAIVHTDVHYSRSDDGPSRSDSVVSDVRKSDSLTDLRGSLEDIARSHTGETELSDDKVDPWLAEVVAGNADDVCYYRDVSDVIKNLDSILNSEKTSSSESSHQASPAREQLALNVTSPQRPNPPSSLVKSPGISDFRSILEELPPSPYTRCVEELALDGLQHSEETTPTGDVTPRAVELDVVELANASANAVEANEKSEQAENVQITNEQIIPRVASDDVKEETPEPNADTVTNEQIIFQLSSDEIKKETPKPSADVGESEIAEIPPTSKEISVEHEITNERPQNFTSSTTQYLNEHGSVSGPSREEVEIEVWDERILDVSTVRAVREFVNDLISDAENDSRVRMRQERVKGNGDRVDMLCVKDQETGEFDCREVEYERNAHCVPSLKDLCAARTSSSVHSVKNEPKDCAYSCDNLFNVQSTVDEVSRDNSDIIEPDQTREVTEKVELPVSILTLETNSNTNTQNKTPEDLSEGLEISEKNSISDTEVLSADNDSTVYMDLKAVSVNVSVQPIDKPQNKGVEKDINKLCDGLRSNTENLSNVENDVGYNSTQYLDLPQTLIDTSKFIEAEKCYSILEYDLTTSFYSRACKVEESLATSTPNVEAQNVDAIVDIIENATEDCGSIPDYDSAVRVTRLEQQCVPDYVASPEQKSLEQSEGTEETSVVLGPFENCTLDYFTGIKTEPEPTDSDIPQEELLAFSSNFVEFNLNSANVSFKIDEADDVPAYIPEEQSKRFGPSTPPNTPGYCFPSPQDFVVNAPLDYEPSDLSHIQLTTKLAIADNENNFNIEYSSVEEQPPPPLEPVVDEVGLRTPPECDECPTEPRSSRDAANRTIDSFDEDSMKALRDELELKLPLAQASGCEPIEDFMLELPPPPVDEDESESSGRSEVVVNYRGDMGALSPIMEETDPQLNAYHNNLNWTQRTDSSSSYLVPCEDSTDDLTELVTAVRSELVASAAPANPAGTYDVQKDTNNVISMSTDSLNTEDGTLRDVAMPSTSIQFAPLRLTNAQENSPVEADAEPIQVSPFLLSPTVDSCKVSTNATNPSKTSKPTLPSDAKSSNTHGISEAGSIDSWCSNDTLFNVEDNFDAPIESEGEEEPTRSSGTSAKDDATYVIEDSKSDDRFTPDSVKDDGTYTLIKMESDISDVAVRKTNGVSDETTNDVDDDEENEHSKGNTKMFGKNGTFESLINLQSCEMEIEQMRKPHANCLNMTPPIFRDTSFRAKDAEDSVRPTPAMYKMDSIDISCIKESFIEQDDARRGSGGMTNGRAGHSLDYHFVDIAKSVTSTPLTSVLTEEPAAEPLPALIFKSPQTMSQLDVPEFNVFCSSAEFKPQEDISPIANGEHSSEKSPLVNFSRDNSMLDTNLSSGYSRSSGYLGFETSAKGKPQDSISNVSEKNASDGHSKSDGYLEFKDSAVNKPQGISSIEKDTVSTDGQSKASDDFELETQAKVIPEELSSNESGMQKSDAIIADPDRSTEASSRTKEDDLYSEEVISSSKRTENRSNEDMKENVEIKEISSTDVVNSTQRSPQQNFCLVMQRSPSTDDSSAANSSKCLPTIVFETRMGDIHTYVPSEPFPSGIEFRDENCPNFSNFELSAHNKPQELSSLTNQNVTDIQSENRARYDVSATGEFLSFERSAAMRPQDVSSDMNHSMSNTESSHNFNETFKTFDSHPSQKQPGRIVNISDVSEPTDTTRDSHAYENDESNNLQTEKGDNNSELSPEPDQSEQESEKKLPKPDDYAETELITVDLLKEQNIPSTSSSLHPREDLGFYEPIESKIDSQVSESEETNLHSEDTNLDREISIASTVEESEPTTREMDSLENQLELNEEIVRKEVVSCQKGSQIANCDSVDHDSDVDRAIRELDQVIEENGIAEHDVRSASPSSCASDEYRPIEEERKQMEEERVWRESVHLDMPTPTDVVGINIITNSFIEHEKNYSNLDSYLPLMNDIRFTGPHGDCMTTSFSEESPCDDSSLKALESELHRAEVNASRLRACAGGLRALCDWDGDSDDDRSDDTSSGEFVWKNGGANGGSDGGGTSGAAEGGGDAYGDGGDGAEADGGSESGSGSEGDETEFVPSSWDSSAAPAKSSLKTLQYSPTNDGKKRVVFKRQKYHCVYEYPREVSEECETLPDYSVYAGSLWEALGVGGGVELSYAPTYAHAPMHLYKLPPDSAFENDYGLPDEDFFISSSARPFESLGIMSSTSQFFPGLHSSLRPVDIETDEGNEDCSESPSPLAKPSSLDFTTPDSGVEDVTPGCVEEQPKIRLKLGAPDASSSSESPSPSSPCWESLGGLRHTRDRLKLDLPPSLLNLAPSRHGQRAFSFLAESPGAVDDDGEVAVREPTFSTFGKPDPVPADGAPKAGAPAEAVKGEGTVLDSGDEDSGIESSKATLERDAAK